MTPATAAPQDATPPPLPDAVKHRTRRVKARTSLLAHGQPQVWLTGGALALALAMVVGLLVLVFYQGLTTFWPVPAVASVLRVLFAPGMAAATVAARASSPWA